MRNILTIVSALLLCGMTKSQPKPLPPFSPAEHRALSAATGDLCNRQVALLGEAGTHGDGRTFAFKAALVRRLIERCGYRALFFESGFYDFAEFNRRLRAGEPVSADLVASAIGGLWRNDREVAELIPFIFERARTSRLIVAGIDNNLGSAGAFYSLDRMPQDLTRDLKPEARTSCREALRRRIFYDYGPAGYRPDHRAQVLSCAATMRRAIGSAAGAPPDTRDDRLQMVANIERFVTSDVTSGAQQFGARDYAMFLNFRWLAQRLPKGAKVIVWGATIHTAKMVPVDSALGGARNLGSYLHQAYGRRAFSLGFAAQGGSYRSIGQTGSRPVPVPPPDSVEAVALPPGDSDVTYLARARLKALGVRPAAIFNHDYVTVRTAAMLDGLVLFREERPPLSSLNGRMRWSPGDIALSPPSSF